MQPDPAKISPKDHHDLRARAAVHLARGYRNKIGTARIGAL